RASLRSSGCGQLRMPPEREQPPQSEAAISSASSLKRIAEEVTPNLFHGGPGSVRSPNRGPTRRSSVCALEPQVLHGLTVVDQLAQRIDPDPQMDIHEFCGDDVIAQGGLDALGHH